MIQSRRKNHFYCIALLIAVLTEGSLLGWSDEQDVVINEVLYNPTEDCTAGEFIEIHNKGAAVVDLSSWFLTGGIGYTIPEGTKIKAKEYLVLAQDPAVLQQKFSLTGIQVLGPYQGQLSNDGEEVSLLNKRSKKIDQVDWKESFPWPVAADGEGASLELINPALENSHAGYWRAALPPTPGRQNSVYAETAPPAILNVKHEPAMPKSGETAVVSVQVLDSLAISEVKVEYQVVKPGLYIRLTDSAYQTSWLPITARDDGKGPDQNTGDSIFTARIPAQEHRTLVRYRIAAQNSQNGKTVAPHPLDPSPNFAYFVYDGIPPYEVTKPSTKVHTNLERVPVYHMISHPNDIRACETDSRVDRRAFNWLGTFVFDGKVYDHIRYRLRGGTWRYSYPKRYWKIRFNKGQYFEGRFNDGIPYPVPRKTLNLNAASQNPGISNPHPGESGFYEAMGFWLFRQMGLLSPHTTFIHFRIVDNSSETGADQTGGDFYGLYNDVEQPDERLLEAHGYPENSNWYKMNNGWTGTNTKWEKETNNCDPADDSDIAEFYYGYNRKGTAYLEQNLDLDEYYSYRAIMDAIHHYDVYAEKNYYYIQNRETGLWEVTPWDLDLTFGNDHGGGTEPFQGLLIGMINYSASDNKKYSTPYRNRLRDVLQLLFDEEVLFPILDQWYDQVKEIAAADIDRWWGKGPNGVAYKALDVRLKEMKTWITNRITRQYNDGSMALNDIAKDTAIPNTPAIQTPAAASYSQAKTTFAATPYKDPNRNRHMASRWIVTREGDLEIQPDWDSGETQENKESIEVDLSRLQPGPYRLRVKYLDDTGRWSFWSDPYQFTVTEPVGVQDWMVQ